MRGRMEAGNTRVVIRTTPSTVVDEHRPWGDFPIFLLVSVCWDGIRPQEIDQETTRTWLLEAV